MNFTRLSELLKETVQTDALLYLERHAGHDWACFERMAEFIEALSADEANASSPLETAAPDGRSVRLPASMKELFGKVAASEHFPSFWAAAPRSYPLSWVFYGFRELMKISPRLAWILGEMNLASAAALSFHPSASSSEKIRQLFQGESGAFLCVDPRKSGHLPKVSGEGDENSYSIRGGLADLPMGNHDLFREGFYVHLTRDEETGENHLQAVFFGDDEENGPQTLGMINQDGGDIYTAHVLFGHEAPIRAESLGPVNLLGKAFVRLRDATRLNSVNLSLGAAKIACGEAAKVFRGKIVENPEFLCADAEKLMRIRSSLSAAETALHFGCLYHDLTAADLKAEKAHFERLAKIVVALLGSHFLNEAANVFAEAEQMTEEARGPNCGDFATLKGLIRCARTHNLSLAENYRETALLLMKEKKERCFEALLKEMQKLEGKIAENSLTNECLIRWREGVASLILMIEHLRENSGGDEESELLLQTRPIVESLGLVAGGYFLLLEALRAEEKLAESGFDFESAATETKAENEEERRLLEIVMEAEHYCLNRLNAVEGLQKSIYRNCLAPLALA